MHPGPFNPVRIASRSVERARHFRLRLQPGLSAMSRGQLEPVAV
jgi:hypothetical protein